MCVLTHTPHIQAARLLADPEEDGWERTDFPVVCEDCLGPNPYIRMQKVRAATTTKNVFPPFKCPLHRLSRRKKRFS
jgi:hypothetical protein